MSTFKDICEARDKCGCINRILQKVEKAATQKSQPYFGVQNETFVVPAMLRLIFCNLLKGHLEEQLKIQQEELIKAAHDFEL